MVFDKPKLRAHRDSMSAPSWCRELPPRLRSHWRLKSLWIPVSMAAFFWAYFLVLRHPWFRVTTMPATAADRWIGFHPGSLALYVSLWLYVLIPPALMDDRPELARFARAAVLLAGVGLAIFVAWPTAVPAWGIDWARYGALAPLKSVDATGNACPSLHAAFAVFCAVWTDRLLRRIGAPGYLRALNAAWCAGILYSTVATRQHVAVDLAAGAALGALVAAAIRPRPAPLS